MASDKGVTRTERFLARLARTSFLSLWSYPNPHRDQGRVLGRGYGKELCDLLVVCANDVVIFSDKECAFPETGRLHLDWTRWFRNAVQDGARQIFGAENKIRHMPDRIFLDPGCSLPLPAPLPRGPLLRVHRVVVAHGVSKRYARELGHTRDSLRVVSRLKEKDHVLPPEAGGIPLAIGHIAPDRGFVHVLDQETVGPLLEELNTITDFLGYLQWKERAITTGGVEFAESELDLLGFYLASRDDDGRCSVGRAGHALRIGPATWEALRTSKEYAAKTEADRISFALDHLIEGLTQAVRDGTVLPDYTEGITLGGLEQVLRAVALESRTRRRTISGSIVAKIRRTPHDKYSARVIRLPPEGSPWYVLAVCPRRPGKTEQEYRDKRFGMLVEYCLATKIKMNVKSDIIGIATEPGYAKLPSTDVMILKHEHWVPEQERLARDIVARRPFFEFAGESWLSTSEYPSGGSFPVTPLGGRPPQSSGGKCRCGSGKRYQNCCGRRW